MCRFAESKWIKQNMIDGMSVEHVAETTEMSIDEFQKMDERCY